MIGDADKFEKVEIYKTKVPKDTNWQQRNIKNFEIMAYSKRSRNSHCVCKIISDEKQKEKNILIVTHSTESNNNANYKGIVKKWKFKDPTKKNTFINDTSSINILSDKPCKHSLQISNNSRYVIIDKIVYDLKNEEMIYTMELSQEYEYEIYFTRFINDEYILSISRDNESNNTMIHIFDFMNKLQVKEYSIDHAKISTEIMDINLCKINECLYQIVFCYGKSSKVFLYNLRLNTKDVTFDIEFLQIIEIGNNIHLGEVHCISFSPNCKLLSILTNYADYFVYFKNNKNEWTLLFHENVMNDNIGSSNYHNLCWIDNNTLCVSCGYSMNNLYFVWIRDGSSNKIIKLLYKYGNIPTDLSQLILSYVAEWEIDKYQINAKWATQLRVVSLSANYKNNLGLLVANDFSGKLIMLLLENAVK